jgi:hypothetical protein
MMAEDYGDRFRQYYINPLLWVEDFFGDNIKKKSKINTRTGLSEQQEEGLRELGKLIEAKLKKHRGEELTKEEEAYSKKIGISIMSGKGTGKDFWGALVSLFFMMFEDVHSLATANSAKQLRNVFWKEISNVMSLSLRNDPNDSMTPTILEEILECQSEKLYMKHLKGKRWFMEAVTVPDRASEEEQGKTLTGRHADHMCFILDEAAGLPDVVFEKLEGTLTGKLNIIILIFNPVRRTGFAAKSHHEDKGKWIALRWNSEDSPLVSDDHIENLAKYGKDSNIYRVDVLGLPPIAGSDTFIPYDWVMDAKNREINYENEPIIKGVDVGAGGDFSVILTRQGGRVTDIESFNEPDTMIFTGRIAQHIMNDDPDATCIDVIGIGTPVLHRLREQGYEKVYAVDVRRKAISERYVNRRDELAQKVRKMFEDGTISIPDNERLINQLLSIKLLPPDSTGHQPLEPKKAMKRRLGESPDEFDSLCMSVAFEDSIFRSPVDEDAYDRYDDSNHNTQSSWMSGY